MLTYRPTLIDQYNITVLDNIHVCSIKADQLDS